MATNDPITLLLHEHEIISSARDVITEADRLWIKDEESYEEVLRALMFFFGKYSDGFHHQKEEMALFPALKNHPDFHPQELLDELENHHRIFRDRIGRMQRALDDKKFEDVQSELTAYWNELLDHMAVENDELFVMTESLLGEADLERMYFRFKDIDHELGEDLKKELESTPAKLKAML